MMVYVLCTCFCCCELSVHRGNCYIVDCRWSCEWWVVSCWLGIGLAGGDSLSVSFVAVVQLFIWKFSHAPNLTLPFCCVTIICSLSQEDYDLKSDIEAEAFTKTIYSYKSDPGIGQHPNANRGASEVNFATSATNSVSDATKPSCLIYSEGYISPSGVSSGSRHHQMVVLKYCLKIMHRSGEGHVGYV